jgi:lysophospholipase L1-like esterase
MIYCNRLEKTFIPSTRLKIVLAIVGVFAGLIVMEIGLQLLTPPGVFDEFQTCVFTPDEKLGYRFTPNVSGRIYRNFEMDNTFKINSQGYHDLERGTQSGTIPILALGDSVTAALYVPIEQGWTQLLQRNLHDSGYLETEVINLGVDGYGTNSELELLKEILPVISSPLMILAFFENDAGDVKLGRIFRECYRDYLMLYQNEEQRAGIIQVIDENYPTSLQTWLFDHLLLFRLLPVFSSHTIPLLRSNFVRPGNAGLPFQPDAGEKTLDEIFQDIITLSQEQHFQLLVIPFPGRETGSTISLDVLKANISNQTFTALDVIDISPIVARILAEDSKQNADLFWENDGHFNAYGNQVYAAAVAEILKTQYGEVLER